MNGTSRIPNGGRIKEPTITPNAATRSPHLLPPYCFTKKRFVMISAPNKMAVRMTMITQKETLSTVVSIMKWYKINATHINSAEGMIGKTNPIKLPINNNAINIQMMLCNMYLLHLLTSLFPKHARYSRFFFCSNPFIIIQMLHHT